ncbi:hypothetical protein GDO81_029634 [Engystomops pustulosus]|uniref:Uncharacterized protein n=1 Tax=Engystomops pustulosus TaxID=76066 RepID=A0AAV6ZNT9_ENGPU|nr:hypothetical protein GDO81_029634 [Engystomops pustulosus]
MVTPKSTVTGKRHQSLFFLAFCLLPLWHDKGGTMKILLGQYLVSASVLGENLKLGDNTFCFCLAQRWQFYLC